jgi:hypothetical protein
MNAASHVSPRAQPSMNRIRCRPRLFALAASVSIGVAASCSSDDQAPGRGRVEHPTEPGPKVAPSPSKAPPPLSSIAAPEASAAALSPPPVERSLSTSEEFERRTGVKLSPIEKAMMDDCPERVWSKSVPKRRCKKDKECGDGFCDRGRCAAVWSCAPNYGQRCESNKDCLYTPCVDERCRSCTSDAECETIMDFSPTTCRPDPDVSSLRECSGIASKMGIITRAPQGNGASDAGP